MRQELEQLRLEFLAREERYVLDGDRDELNVIRKELSQMRVNQSMSSLPHKPPVPQSSPLEERRPAPKNASEKMKEDDRISNLILRLQKKKDDLLQSGVYDENEDPIIAEINNAIKSAEDSMRIR